MTLYRVFIDDSKYSGWRFIKTETQEDINLDDINPLDMKLFNNDIFTFTNSNISLEVSTAREQILSGVLILDKIYGKQKNGKNERNLYKCVPHDKHLPEFLIPYTIKTQFSKNLIPIYVCFKFSNWTDKHPTGTITKTIGPVNVLSNFYEYHICCKNLDFPLKEFKQKAHEAMKGLSTTPDEFLRDTAKDHKIEDRTSQKCYSIDNQDTTDYDDAFSITFMDDGTVMLSVYISNVVFWINELDLWKTFSQRISTIYLPDQKRPMLPTLLSDSICSLKEGEDRIAFTMDVYIYINREPDIKFKNTLIRVTKNLSYDGWNKHYNERKYCENVIKYCKMLTSDKINNGHDLINFLMVFMNHNAAKYLSLFNVGIYRNIHSVECNVNIPETLPKEVHNTLKIMKSAVGQYVKYNEKINHEFLNLDCYLHITSPIRRLVDLLNMIELQNRLCINVNSKKSEEQFYKKWLQKLDYINTTMRAIRKVQNDCSMLAYFEMNPIALSKIYTGYVFDKIKRTDLQYQYNVYIPEIKLTTRITVIEDFDDYSEHLFSVYTFSTEYNVKKKIKLQLIKP